MVLSTAAKLGLVAFLASTYKTLPLAYTVRFYLAVLRSIVLQRSAFLKNRENTYGYGKGKLDIFQAVSYSTYASPLEIDMYMHKSNSTYFMDLDIARTKLICRVFQKLFMNFWDNTSGEFRGKSLQNSPFVPIGTVQCSFKREIKMFQNYKITSNVMAWDNKWLYVLSKFTIGDNKLCAVAVTKYVFKKKGRVTLRPSEFIAECGLYNDEVEEISQQNLSLVSDLQSSDELEKLAAKM